MTLGLISPLLTSPTPMAMRATGTFILMRHGETDWNVEGRHQGQSNPPLNKRGLAQAHRLAEELQNVGLDVLYSSPLLRALQTARVLAECLHLPLHMDSRLMEIHQGEWDGRLYKEIATRYPALFQRWQTEPRAVTPLAGERLDQVQARVYAALDETLARHAGQCLGLVTHRIPVAIIKIRYQGLDPNAVRTLELPNIYWEEIRVP